MPLQIPAVILPIGEIADPLAAHLLHPFGEITERTVAPRHPTNIGEITDVH